MQDQGTTVSVRVGVAKVNLNPKSDNGEELGLRNLFYNIRRLKSMETSSVAVYGELRPVGRDEGLISRETGIISRILRKTV